MCSRFEHCHRGESQRHCFSIQEWFRDIKNLKKLIFLHFDCLSQKISTFLKKQNAMSVYQRLDLAKKRIQKYYFTLLIVEAKAVESRITKNIKYMILYNMTNFQI